MEIIEIEKQILKFWRESHAFKRSVDKRSKNRSFVFFEGPPTANGRPGFHHVEARSFKDVICRYKTMKGFCVERRGGWDTHGLPVELEVERELGINNKKQIEEYGIAKFNEKCKDSVWKYKKDWENLTERMGFWIDLDNPYITYDPLYMESLWWVIKQMHEKGLLYEGYKVIPRCPRCGTGLSSHEVAQGYEDVTENSVFIKFRVKNPTHHSLPTTTFLLAWTTTPWTLPGNVALAIGKDIKYSLVQQNSEYYILATPLLKVLEGGYKVIKELEGSSLVGIEYEPLFDSFSDIKDRKHYVVEADFVTTEEGTGIVHTAVMYGEDDYNLGVKLGLPKYHTVDENGRFNERVKEFAGRFVKDAEPAIIDRLKAKNQLYKVLPYKHSYPFCWRCKTPLLYYAMNSWFVGISKLREELINANKKINWVPDYLKEGRFGEWLREVKDWAFSRSRYWGTPLPIWKCNSCKHMEVVGSRSDLSQLTRGKNKYFVMRHGYAGHNKLGMSISSIKTDNPKYGLTQKGIKEVKKSALELKKKGGIDVIVSSPLIRTRQTAEIVATQLGIEDIIFDKELIEIGVGNVDGKKFAEYEKLFKTEKEKFTENPHKGETLAALRERMMAVMNKLEKKYKGKKILLVSHGDPIWMLETSMQGRTVDETINCRLSNNYIKTGQFRELNYGFFPYNKGGELDFHRPFVDEIKFKCNKCKKGQMSRVKDLVDVWFDSGAMPLASLHYPFENKNAIDKGTNYPAEYICEAIDQTRGWFYTLHAISVILGKAPAYKNVISLGHVLDEKGQKMSKSKGNIVDPWKLADVYGMDAVRWYFFTVNNPGAVKRFSERDVKERLHRFILTFLNSYIFLHTYSSSVRAPKKFSDIKTKNSLDLWVSARLKELSKKVSQYMDSYNVVEAARIIDEFVMQDLSNWYVRRSRERFQKPKNKIQKSEAEKTLSFVLSEVAKLIAPFTPFVAEYVWQKVNKKENTSVHWEDYPKYLAITKKEQEVLNNMKLVQDWAQVGLSIRSDNAMRVRQPLQALAVPKVLDNKYMEILKEELNVKEVINLKNVDSKNKNWKTYGQNNEVMLDIELSEALRLEGNIREMIRHIQGMRKSLKLHPADKIKVEYSLPQTFEGKLAKWEARIAQDTNATKISEQKVNGEKHDAKVEFKWDNRDMVIMAIDKV
ncbi:MAG: hypothetical protein A3F94_00205 [Candidatus Spechtbacteria bacterium RIFCSPLOWO2_12_FULL_38_22]|uniref:Isoleucine--tRNA ligase n=1 Tax=Candidatus Spechtbacteria bacterium RIFCSPLOWO2_12_FULL_38_22 TaxID=1802165 RepID=A0A1G2HGP3_9BACT|nr:MAG: hypothetical protein A2728_02005 [Candidatus Spechtbacteria bacterium RIFCSPHIGHO2_01_FULL_38_11]OGZ61549.1 MAG: hypothetical protein A3F94_00205 [Candidatus Spechtbacteria bacterium RIFCSPLOWO2_12_FULL_38_22]